MDDLSNKNLYEHYVFDVDKGHGLYGLLKPMDLIVEKIQWI